jgi:hypothetical protein
LVSVSALVLAVVTGLASAKEMASVYPSVSATVSELVTESASARVLQLALESQLAWDSD